MLGILAAPSLLENCKNNAVSSELTSLQFALDHFEVTENQIQKVLAAALEKGGHYADLFFEHTFSNSLHLQDKEVNHTSSNIDYGMGVRVVSGEQSGYAYIENITLKNAAKLISALRSSELDDDLDDRQLMRSTYVLMRELLK